MASTRRPPAWTPMSPSFHPAMTLAVPNGDTSNVCCAASHDASNCCLVDQWRPTYLTLTESPRFAAGPLPAIASAYASFVGAVVQAGESGTDSVGLVAGSAPTDMMQPPTAIASCFAGRCVGVGLAVGDDDEHAAMALNNTAAASAAHRFRWVRTREGYPSRLNIRGRDWITVRRSRTRQRPTCGRTRATWRRRRRR